MILTPEQVDRLNKYRGNELWNGIDVRDLLDTIDALNKLVARWKKAVEGLTPSGSEFVDDPEACAAYIRKRCQYPQMIIDLREQVDALNKRLADTQVVTDEILSIMKVYHQQEAKGNIDTPGGFEHMGDVWSRFLIWERLLLESRLAALLEGKQ